MAAVIAGCLISASAIAEEGVRQAGLVGNHEYVWVYDHRDEADGNAGALHFGCRPTWNDRFLFPSSLQGLPGRVHSVTILGNHLHVIFDEGTHRRYSFEGRRITGHSERPLPGQSRPLVLCASEETRSLYAVVTRAVAAEALRESLAEAERREQENANADEDVQAPLDVEAILGNSRYALLRYKASCWDAASAVPTWFNDQTACLLACDEQERVHLFFSKPPDLSFQHAQYVDGRWTQPGVIGADPPTQLFGVFTVGPRAVCVASAKGGDPAAMGVRSYDGSQWLAPRPIELRAPIREAPLDDVYATRFEDSIAIAWRDVQGDIRFGRWPMEGGQPLEAPASVEGWGRGDRAIVDWQIQSIAAFAVLGMLLVYVFWRRQDAITRQLELPEEYEIAAYWRRLAAFVIDVVPIAMLTIQLWIPSLNEWMRDYRELEVEGGRPPPLTLGVLTGWMLACGTYILYCTICEAAFATTPGKYAVRCRVVDEEGQPCRLVHIIARNVLRAVELFPLFQLWPTLILILFTRNRQRLGDLLARTVVVQRVSPANPPPAPPGDEDQDQEPKGSGP